VIPVVDNAHVAEGQALLISKYQASPNIANILKSLMLKIQDVENAYWSIISGVQLSNHPRAGGPWGVLDKIGAIVSIPRNALSDAAYLVAIRIKIRINRSHGLAEDIIQIAALVAAGAKYYEWESAAFEVDIFNTTAAIVLALQLYLGEARSAGTAGTLRYSVDANPLVIWSDSVNPGLTPGAGFASSYGGATSNKLSALARL
jgi:hypothetical protein